MSVDVSVIVPVYNCAERIERVLETVLTQDSALWECIVVDDCSNDGTYERVQECIGGRKNCTVVRLEHNSGPSAARNAGLYLARGEYVTFMDADDELLPGALATMIRAAECSEADLVVCDYIAVTESRTEHRKDPFTGAVGPLPVVTHSLCGKLWNHLHGKLYRRSLVAQFPFPEGLHRYEDLVVNTVWYSYANTIHYEHVPVYKYMIHSASLTWSQPATLENVEKPYELIRLGLNLSVAGQIDGKAWNVLFATLIVLTVSGGIFAEGGRESIGETANALKRLSLGELFRVAQNVPFTGVAALLLRFSPRLYTLLYTAYTRRKFGILRR